MKAENCINSLNESLSEYAKYLEIYDIFIKKGLKENLTEIEFKIKEYKGKIEGILEILECCGVINGYYELNYNNRQRRYEILNNETCELLSVVYSSDIVKKIFLEYVN